MGLYLESLKILIHGALVSDNQGMKRIIFFIILAFAFGLSLSAQKVWEGTVIAGRYGDFPPTGYYGASNVFPRNSLVNVQNILNGKVVQIIISGGLEDPSLFLTVSRQAADALELQRNDSANVRVALAVAGSDVIMPGYADLPYSTDPEINPAARAGDVNAIVEKDPPLRDEKKEKQRPPVAAVPLPDSPAEEPPSPVPEETVIVPEEKPSISDRLPADDPKDFEIKESPFAELPEEKPSISERMAAETAPRVNEDWVLGDMDTAPEPQEDIAGALPVPGEPEPAPEASETETIVTLEPAEARPPAEDTESVSDALDSIIADIPERPVPLEDSEWAKENLPLVASLPEKSYYLQVASYKNPEKIKPLVDTIAAAYPVYPVVVLAGTGGDPFYRIMVGPLREDERGLMLHQLKAKGYKDAFLKEIR
jgi:hypothetical protein